MTVLFEQMTIIGVGLIGGSLARAARERGLVSRFVGAGRSLGNLERALELGVVDRFETDHLEAVRDSDLVVVCTPVRSAVRVTEAILPEMAPGALLTDVGSVKAPYVRAVEAMDLGEVKFLASHPVAGGEKTGVEASFSSLFEAHQTILTPTERTHPESIERLRALWEGVGANVEILDPETHDRVMADISHLPHLVAYAMMNTALGGEALRHAASGFRDFSRIASSGAEMWREICEDNQEALISSLDRFERELAELRRLLKEADSEGLERAFQKAKDGRDEWARKKGWA
ncbi:MAG: prephenate dehydrogenase/arogenate dehydrogenase family protein [Nitrospinae bacterium]|nr:prephenate dehydrogenase/arogenate dehydrogenase family protein [Nitrospinota bacterium]